MIAAPAFPTLVARARVTRVCSRYVEVAEVAAILCSGPLEAVVASIMCLYCSVIVFLGEGLLGNRCGWQVFPRSYYGL